MPTVEVGLCLVLLLLPDKNRKDSSAKTKPDINGETELKAVRHRCFTTANHTRQSVLFQLCPNLEKGRNLGTALPPVPRITSTSVSMAHVR